MGIANETSPGQQVLHMLNEGKRREEIEEILLGKGHDQRFVRDLVQQTMKLRDAKMRSQGLTLILSGAVICFLSFVLTITSSFTHTSFPMVLYGLTSIGIIVVFAGFMKVF